MKSLTIILLSAAVIVSSAVPARAQTKAAPWASPSASATATPDPTPIPLADVVTQANAVEATLQDMQTKLGLDPQEARIAKDLPTVTQGVSERLAETTHLLGPGVPLETLRDLEVRWIKLDDQLNLWARELTTRANLIDKQIALLPDQQATWETLELAQTSDTPPEIRQRIGNVLTAIKETETALQKRRSSILSEQGWVAEQSKRVADVLASIRAAQNAAVGHLFVRDSAPLWVPAEQQRTTHDLIVGTQASVAAQSTELRAYVAHESAQFVYLGLIFCGLATALFWVKRRISKWTDQDPALAQANRVLHLPIATAAVLTLIFYRALFDLPPRLFLALLGAIALAPIVIILRQLIDRHLFPIVNALVVFYLIAQLRRIAGALPELSRFILLSEMIGGAIFLVWFIRSTPEAPHGTISHRATRAGARLGLFLFAVVFLANVFGYLRLANYLASGALATAYFAIFLYAARGILVGLIFFALHVRPLTDLRVVRRHRPLLQERFARIISWLAFLIWVLFVLDALSLRVPFLKLLTGIVTAEVSFRSLHLSLGAILAFALTLWIATLLSRLIRFLLEEDIYDRFHFDSGSSYATSTLLHYVILLVGFFCAIAALGMDMTKFTVLVGALGVGIGFGLQSIINNFVSGLVLLFERPVKVGDVVQVGDATGVIRRIGIRASIIRIADSSELIVPNGQLISEKVTNWTLSNRQRRIEVRVGVAYGTDPKRVIELLTQVAAAHPLASKYPEPQILMTEFGPDSLNFAVRLWTDDYDQWLQIQSDVAVAINDALAAANITIPFPQRDLHLQSIDPSVAAALGTRREDSD